jgi:putative ABC transport system substrate-binding protein
MIRRDFITLLGGAAAWPLAALAQQPVRMRRIGVLMPLDENDPVWKPRLSAFTQALPDLGWTEGRNARMDLRWAGDDTNRIRALAQELVGLQPDIILAHGTPATVALQRGCRKLKKPHKMRFLKAVYSKVSKTAALAIGAVAWLAGGVTR